MTRNNPISRRTALKGLGGTLATVGVGGAALLATTGPAAAANFDIGDPVTITSDDGTVDYVAIYGDSVVRWSGFEQKARAFTLDIRAKVVTRDDGTGVAGWTNLHSTGRVDLGNADWGNYDEDLSGPGTTGYIASGIGLDEDGNHDASVDWHIVGDDTQHDYGLPSNSIDPSVLEVDTDGNSLSFDIVMESTYTWYSEVDGGEELHEETFSNTIPVDVNNKPSTASASDGDGEDGAVGGPTPTPTATPDV